MTQFNLSELASRMLAELEEAGSENFPTLVNTALAPKGHHKEIQDSVDALEELLETGLVFLAWQHSGYEPMSSDEARKSVAELAQTVSFDTAERYWKWDQTRPFVEIVATEIGMVAARQILNEHGYQWWRQTPES